MAELSRVKNIDALSGFGFLIEKFSGLAEIPTLPDICGWLAEAAITDEEIAPYRYFSPDKYTRNQVFRNEFVELLVLGWLPGQISLIHDHDGSHGVIRVFEGMMIETKFGRGADQKLFVGTKRNVSEGMLAGVGEPDIHQLSSIETEGQNSITIHVYAPPLKGLNVYEVGSAMSEFYPELA